MKQILQHLGTGETLLVDVPCPALGRGELLLETRASLVSLGTEKMLVDFGKSGWIAKARSQPEKVKQVLQKIRTDGLGVTVDAVRAKLDQPIALGYSQVGTLVEERCGSRGLALGKRYVSNGSHAEVVAVPKHLCAAVPDGVSDEAAAFTVVGAIGLQGIRLLAPSLGERVVVVGLGLIGLMAVQMLQGNGCRVLGIDLDPTKCALAREFGAEICDISTGADPVAVAEAFSEGAGVDGVLVTASAKTDMIMSQAADMCRKRARIVLVGVVGLQLNRADFYEKELSFQVSCSYGPGRYERNYEEKGLDYPIGFVRWTEQRNMEAVLGLLANGVVDVAPLITHRFAFDEALKAYETVSDGDAMGIVLQYAKASEENAKKVKLSTSVSLQSRVAGSVGIGFIGAGQFTSRMLLPALKLLDVRFRAVVSRSGISGTHVGAKFGFERSLTDVGDLLTDDAVSAVFVTTQHHTHASFVVQALRAGKHVFVEKPLCLTRSDLDEIREAVENSDRVLMVGYNRRFSPHTVQLQSWLAGCTGPKSVIVTVNAGALPEDHWTQDQDRGGGRILGEACHFVDLARCLIGSPIVNVSRTVLGGHEGRLGDSMSIQLDFEDGSMATVHYLATGHKGFPKERIEVFVGGKVLCCDNFRVTHAHGLRGRVKTRSQDKGHAACVAAFVNSLKNGTGELIPRAEIFEVMEVMFGCVDKPAVV